MHIDPNPGGAFFQVAAVAITAITALLLVFSQHIRSGLARVRRRITRPQDVVRMRRNWRN
jgi:hypothetical protein